MVSNIVVRAIVAQYDHSHSILRLRYCKSTWLRTDAGPTSASNSVLTQLHRHASAQPPNSEPETAPQALAQHYRMLASRGRERLVRTSVLKAGSRKYWECRLGVTDSDRILHPVIHGSWYEGDAAVHSADSLWQTTQRSPWPCVTITVPQKPCRQSRSPYGAL